MMMMVMMKKEGGEEGEEEGRRRGRGRRRGGEELTLKSNNPNLTGGEKLNDFSQAPAHTKYHKDNTLQTQCKP